MTQQSHYWTYTREKHESKWHLNSMFIVAICISQDMETAQMSINRGMDEEDPYINGILLSHKNEQNRIIYRDVNGPRDYDTKWNKSEREKQISHISTETSSEWEINSARPIHEDLGLYCPAGAGSAYFSISCLG